MSVLNMATPEIKQFKVVLLGEGSVGKTSLFLMFLHQQFNPAHKTTLQATYERKRITLPDKTRVDLNIWDTAGQERFHTLGPIYYRNSHGAILVYDITDANSFERVQNWVKELRKMLGNDVVLVIVGNKIDLERGRVVNKQKAEEFSTTVGAKHFETSAKLNQGINEMFSDLTKMMLAKDHDKDVEDGIKRKPKGFLIEPQPQETKKDEGCCGSSGS